MVTRYKLGAALLLAAGTAVSAQSLTTDTPNNGSGGVFMDLTAAHPLEVIGFDVAYSGATGTPVDVEIWIRPGSYVGFESSSFGWTLTQTVSGVREGPSVLSPLNLTTPIELDEGVTTAVYLHCITSGGGIRYNGTAASPPQTTWQNADLTLFSNVARTGDVPFAGGFFTPRTFAGTIRYQPGGPPTPGACCFPDGSCQDLLGSECFNQGGSFRGGGTECATETCPQPGACCLQWGGCEVMLETACENVNGTFEGGGTTCPATCAPSGGCCLADGSCVVVTEDQCSTIFSGTWAGADVNCGEARCATAPVLWNHGPLKTSELLGCGGADVSELQNQPPINGNSLGFNWNNASNSRLADQFIIPEGEQWNIEEVILFGYDTGAFTVTYTAAFIQIWDGDPRDPASNIVAGDQTTNVLTQADQMNLYRATVLAPLGCDRRIQEIQTNFQATLGPGTYWIDRSGLASGTPWMPPVTFSDLGGKPNATGLSFFAEAWAPRTDSGNNVQQDMPFILIGTIEDDCYANCDGSTTEPILTVDDFTCFINEFAEAQSLPVAQQITHYANCDGSTTEPILTVDDFTCFINAFAEGCP